MKKRIFKTVLSFILFSFVLVTSTYAATVKEDVGSSKYTSGAYVIGSTRFDKDQVITGSMVYEAGLNEAKLNVALGKEITAGDKTFYYFVDESIGWMKVGETSELLTEEETENLEKNLNIFFENNVEKKVEVEYTGDVDVDSLPEGVEYDEETGKFIIPATVFEFTFKTEDGDATVSTNVDKNMSVESDEIIESVVKEKPQIICDMPNKIFANTAAEFDMSVLSKDYDGAKVIAGGVISPDENFTLEIFVEDEWHKVFINTSPDTLDIVTLEDMTAKFRITYHEAGEYEFEYYIKDAENKEIIAKKVVVTEVIPEDAAVEVNREYFTVDKIADAIKKSSATHEAILLKDITVDEVIAINSEEKIDAVLNLNGNVLTGTGSDVLVLSGVNSSLVIKNGTIEAKGSAAVVADTRVMAGTATLVIAEDAMIVGDYYGLFVAGNGAKLDVYGTVEAKIAGYAISGTGNLKENDNTQINIYEDAIVKSENGTAIYLPQKGVTNIYGGTLTGQTVVGMKSGALNILGGTLTATGTKVELPSATFNGIDPTGDVVFIESNENYAGNVEVTIEAGELSSTTGADILRVYKSTSTADAIVEGMEIDDETSNETVIVYIK